MEHEIVKEIYEIHNKNKKANLEKIVKKDTEEKSKVIIDKEDEELDKLDATTD